MASPDLDPRVHAWWSYVPESQRARKLQAARNQRWLHRLQQRKTQIALLVGIYAAVCTLPLFVGVQSLAMLALLPLLLLPALGLLAYWLTWKEFHH